MVNFGNYTYRGVKTSLDMLVCKTRALTTSRPSRGPKVGETGKIIKKKRTVNENLGMPASQVQDIPLPKEDWLK